MARPIQQPETRPGHRDGETIQTHPAYGMIGASRVSGNAVLYGSDFLHRQYIAIRIHRSELARNLSNDWHHANDELIEVHLSEAQWATFVSSMNQGNGVPCTIDSINCVSQPGLPQPKSREKQFTGEAKETLQDALRAIKKAIQVTQQAKTTPAKVKQEITYPLSKAIQEIEQNLGFVLEQFAEHTENITEHAKIEVSAYVTNAIQRAGLQALQAPVVMQGAITDES